MTLIGWMLVIIGCVLIILLYWIDSDLRVVNQNLCALVERQNITNISLRNIEDKLGQ